jgi:hypothetical protein
VSARAPARRPIALAAACALAVVLGADALRRAWEMHQLGVLDLAGWLRGGLLAGVALALAWRPRPWLALAQTALALWVYADLAPVVGDLAARGFAGARVWLRPLPIAAFAFFPCAFFGWRALARTARPL